VGGERVGAWWMLMERREGRERCFCHCRASDISDLLLHVVSRVWGLIPMIVQLCISCSVVERRQVAE